MRVHGDHVCTEALQLLLVGRGRQDAVYGAVDLQSVVVDDHAQVIQVIAGGEHQRLPDLALLALAVPDQGIDSVPAAVQPGGKRHAAGGRDTLPQRAGGHIHARDMLHIRVPLQEGINPAQVCQLRHREISPQSQRRVQCGGGVSLGEDKAVALRPRGVCGVYAHLGEIQVGQNIGNRQGSSRVPGGGGVRPLQNTESYPVCLYSQIALF